MEKKKEQGVAKEPALKQAPAEALLSYPVNILAGLVDITGKSLKEMELPSAVYNLPDGKSWPCLIRRKLNTSQVEAEKQPEISEAYSISAMPFFVFCGAQ